MSPFSLEFKPIPVSVFIPSEVAKIKAPPFVFIPEKYYKGIEMKNSGVEIHPISVEFYRATGIVRVFESFKIFGKKGEKKVSPNLDLLVALKGLIPIEKDGEKMYQNISQSLSFAGILRAILLLSVMDRQLFEDFVALARALSFVYNEKHYPLPVANALRNIKPETLLSVFSTETVERLHSKDISLADYIVYAMLKNMSADDLEEFAIFSSDPETDRQEIQLFLETIEAKLGNGDSIEKPEKKTEEKQEFRSVVPRVAIGADEVSRIMNEMETEEKPEKKTEETEDEEGSDENSIADWDRL